MSEFKSSVTDYAEIQKRWREIGSALPTNGVENRVDVTPKPAEPQPKAAYDYGYGGTYVGFLSAAMNRRWAPRYAVWQLIGLPEDPGGDFEGVCTRTDPAAGGLTMEKLRQAWALMGGRR